MAQFFYSFTIKKDGICLKLGELGKERSHFDQKGKRLKSLASVMKKN